MKVRNFVPYLGVWTARSGKWAWMRPLYELEIQELGAVPVFDLESDVFDSITIIRYA